MLLFGSYQNLKKKLNLKKKDFLHGWKIIKNFGS